MTIIFSASKQAESIFDNYLAGLEDPNVPENHHLITISKREIKSLFAETINEMRLEILTKIAAILPVQSVPSEDDEEITLYIKGSIDPELFCLLLLNDGQDDRYVDPEKVRKEYWRFVPNREHDLKIIVRKETPKNTKGWWLVTCLTMPVY